MLKEWLDHFTLLDLHREELRGRGFSDDVIERYQWKSCTPFNSFIIDDLKERYGLEQCQKECLYEADKLFQGLPLPQGQLLQSNVLIPYHTRGGVISKLRPHKLGFHGQGAELFRTFSSFERSDTCIIAESEFKAVAAECFGYPAIGIPGITSMSGKNWEYFSKELEGVEAEIIVICFDTEIKDNPDVGKYVADWRQRYNTILYAYIMAQKIANTGRTCFIATLPYEWMERGKIDIDKALAQGRSVDEFARVIKNAVGPKAYIASAPIPDEHRSYIDRKIRAHFYDPKIEIKANCFFQKDTLDDKGVKVAGQKLSNCHIKIKNVYEEFGVIDDAAQRRLRRDICIVDESGVESRSIPILSSSMMTQGKFKEWLVDQGPYLFYGNDKDIIKIWEFVFANDDGNIVYLVNRCGYIREFDFFIFKNVLIKNDVPIYPDVDGIFWVDDMGFKPRSLNESITPPPLVTDDTFDMKKFLGYLASTTDYQNPGMAKALVGWVFSLLFLTEIVAAFKLFPLLFLYGEKGAGKTTILRWLSAFWGQDNLILNLDSCSNVGVNRGMDYFSSLPYIIDDWRNLPKSQQYIPLFLGIYNRQGGMKGVKTQFGAQSNRVNGALVIMGQQLVADSAVMSRCLTFHIPQERIQECSIEIDSMIHSASSYIFNLMTKHFSTMRAQIVQSVKDASKHLKLKVPGIDPRLCSNYAILLASYRTVLGDDPDLLTYIYKAVGVRQEEITEGDEIHKFAHDFIFGVTEGAIKPQFYTFEKDSIFLWVRGITDVMGKFFNRYEPERGSLVTVHLKKQPYYVTSDFKMMTGGGKTVPCVELNLTKMPQTLRVLMEGVRMKDYD